MAYCARLLLLMVACECAVVCGTQGDESRCAAGARGTDGCVVRCQHQRTGDVKSDSDSSEWESDCSRLGDRPGKFVMKVNRGRSTSTMDRQDDSQCEHPIRGPWFIDLGSSVVIENATLALTLADRSRGHFLSVSESDLPKSTDQHTCTPAGRQDRNATFICDSKGRYLHIRDNLISEPEIDICEVTIDGYPVCTEENTYGEHCSGCNCTGCDSITGQCGGACDRGYRKDEGGMCRRVETKDVEGCEGRRWGQGCEKNCSQNCGQPGSCDRETGECEGGCVAGWQGQQCDDRVYDDHTEATPSPTPTKNADSHSHSKNCNTGRKNNKSSKPAVKSVMSSKHFVVFELTALRVRSDMQQQYMAEMQIGNTVWTSMISEIKNGSDNWIHLHVELPPKFVGRVRVKFSDGDCAASDWVDVDLDVVISITNILTCISSFFSLSVLILVVVLSCGTLKMIRRTKKMEALLERHQEFGDDKCIDAISSKISYYLASEASSGYMTPTGRDDEAIVGKDSKDDMQKHIYKALSNHNVYQFGSPTRRTRARCAIPSQLTQDRSSSVSDSASSTAAATEMKAMDNLGYANLVDGQ